MGLPEAAVLQRHGRLEEAEAECRRVLYSRPFDPAPHHMLGTILFQLGRLDEGAELLRRAVNFAPDSVVLRVNLAALLGKAGKLPEALGELRRAIELGGNFPELFNNYGVTLEKLGRFSEAAAAYRAAIARRFSYPEAHCNLGNALRKDGRIDESRVAYRQALSIQPSYASAYDGLASAAADAGDGEEAILCYRKMVELDPASPPTRSALLYTLHYSSRLKAESIADEHREWGRLFCEPLKASIRPHENDHNAERRIKIGYVSPNFYEQTVTKFISAAIQHHDRGAFELFCYSDAEKPDHVTERIRGWVENRGTGYQPVVQTTDRSRENHGPVARATEKLHTNHWRETRGLSDARLEEVIRADRIDILVDLRGHAADNRLTLFARKPAPIAVNMVGYFNTTGLSAIDYRITDERMDPTGATEHLNVEKLVRLEPSCWCYSPEPDAPEVREPPCLRNGYVTFGSLNKLVKISEPCAKLWSKVLEAVPGSKLMLSHVEQPPSAASTAGGSCATRFPKERVILVAKTRTSREYLQRFNQIDIALDTFPFNGITTTCDGLWMGVPCVTVAWATGPCPDHGLVGRATSVSRAGASILHAAGLAELVADTPEQFVRIASELATNQSRLIELRRTMRQRLLASALLDHRGFARKLEAAYQSMWRSWCGESPAR